MVKNTNVKLAELLVELVDGATKAQVPEIMKGFVQELFRRGMLSEWRKIEHEIHGVWKRKYGAANVTIVSAHPITATLRKQIEGLAPGADIVERVDERLMGGAIIRIDDRRIDASIAGSLHRLKAHLLSVS